MASTRKKFGLGLKVQLLFKMARCRAIVVPHFRIYISVYISSHIFHYICLYSPRISSYILQTNCNSSFTKYLPWHTNAHIYCIYEYIHLIFSLIFLSHPFPIWLIWEPVYILVYLQHIPIFNIFLLVFLSHSFPIRLMQEPNIFPFSIYFHLYFLLIHSPSA